MRMGKGLSILTAALLVVLIWPVPFGALERGLAVILLVAAVILVVLRARRDEAARLARQSAQDRADAQAKQSVEAAGELKIQIGQLQQQLEDALETHRLLIDGFPDPAVFMDRDFRVFSMNEAARKRFGDAANGQYCHELIHGREEPCDPDVHPCALATGSSCKEIKKWVGDDGNEHHLEIRTTPLRNKHGQVVGGVEVIHNLNAQEKLALKLQRARADAETTRRARAEFVSTLSHEVRTPMNAVLGMTDLLAMTDMTRKQQTYLSVIQSSGNLLLSLVDNLLGTAELDAGKLELREEAFSVADVHESVLHIMGYQAYSRGIELAGCLSENRMARVVGDRERLRQVMINLIGNAIRFTDRGEVIVRTATRTDETGAARLTVSVVDSGAGMSEGTMATLFKPFSRTKGTGFQRAQQGSGVGLSISKQLIELMGGDLTVSSEIRKGTMASFTVPVRPAEGWDSALTAQDALLSRYRLLLVEANRNVAGVLCDCLQGAGILCRRTGDHEGVPSLLADAAASGSAYDGIIIDTGMGGSAGIELARSLHAEKATRDLPIMLLTSIVHPLEIGEVSVLGAARCVNKPVLMSEMRKSLVELLQLPKASAQDAGVRVNEDRKLAVLVAEDNAISRRVLAGMLQSLDHEVDCVADGPAVLAALEKKDDELILMDCQMPGLDGDEVTRRVRAMTDTGVRQPVIVAVTADISPGHRERCLQAGMDDFIEKPVRLKSLEEGLERWVSDPVPGHAPPPAVSEGSGSLPGSEVLQRLRERAGGFDHELMKGYIDLFLSDTATRLESLRAALERRDYETVRRECHALKGACLELGASEMSHCCEALGEASRDRRVQALPGALESLRREFDRIRPVFEAERSRPA
jgi:PAS domain S-box-containing protein